KVGVAKLEYLSVLDGPVSWAVDRPMVRVGQRRSSSCSTRGGEEDFRPVPLRRRRGRREPERRSSHSRHAVNAMCHLKDFEDEDLNGSQSDGRRHRPRRRRGKRVRRLRLSQERDGKIPSRKHSRKNASRTAATVVFPAFVEEMGWKGAREESYNRI